MNRDKDKKEPDQGVQQALVSTPLVAFLVETYPDIRDPFAAEAAWVRAYPRVDLLAEAVKARAWEVANPHKKKKNHASFLNRWFSNATPAPAPRTHGDQGVELRPWHSLLTDAEKRAYVNERTGIDPDLDGAPFGAEPPGAPEALLALNAQYRAIAEAR